MRKVITFSLGILAIFLGIILVTVAGNGSREIAGAQVAQQGAQHGEEQEKDVADAEQEPGTTASQNESEVIQPAAGSGGGNYPAGSESTNPQASKSSTSQVFVPPSRGYWIEVIIAEQRVRIYHDGDLIKDWPASTGTPDKPTPTGVFAIQNRGEWFFSEKYQQGGRWWVSFKDWGVYLFHSVPMDRQQNIIEAEAARLGTPASHGCVRLATENAKWIYDHIPQGAPVYIH
ncbi:L,D-transpeptidase [Thermanaeromonas sp. C210]|uniref:L,D-transpeptidase n=1 Tax=Thermanaeromonas sp. C210 TaxID=2731925 RepID=UPI00155C611F|nr:L,D-transpeptidase [Thermanaeromonas sp. C210]GFN23922.1 hypothetical protein TAMC210_22390 [Thermanaeromonas sp. C210]